VISGLNAQTVATELLHALASRALVEPLSARDPTFDSAAAYDVSAEIFGRRCARGEQPIGRKIGFTNRTIWDEYGVYSPIWAHVYDTTVTFLTGPTGRLDISHLSQPRIEPEIVLHFRESPRQARDDHELLSTIDWIAHGFEIVQTHFVDWKFRLADTIADFGLHGALVVGPPCEVDRLDGLVDRLRTFTIALAKDGAVAAHGTGANVLDGPLPAALHLMRVLREQNIFESVRAGEIVTTGTLTPALPIRRGETWSTRLSGVELPGLTLRFD
jgi:2-oxo-3-hexenedioate decarboxylase